MANLYNSEGYFSPTEYEALTKIEKDEKAARIAANYRPLVYICSPYSGNTEKNTENARKYSRFAVDSHCLPITPHIYFTQFMDDSIPFKAVIEGAGDIKNYADYLYENAGGAVLSWIIEGARKVYKQGFKIDMPDCVKTAIEGYREDNDWLSQYLTECCEISESYIQKSGELYSDYRSYCARNNLYTRSTTDFYSALENAGFVRERKKSGVLVKGLRLKTDAELDFLN